MPRSSRHLVWLLPFALTASVLAQHEGVVPTAEPVAKIDYLRDVRPILTQHCYRCHGPDEKERKGDLRLDLKAEAFADRDGYAAFVTGNAGSSEAIVRIESDDPDELMPPPDKGDPLKPTEIAILRRWLDEGAAWQQHWAFTAQGRPAPPPVHDGAWPKSDLDAFVLARLEREGLRPSAEASRETWLRRVTFDLIGLPPTPKEIDTFLRDTSADAYEKVVDRLLADERYGERQASEWLDVARYADSSGYQRDVPRQAWKWRDWVIDALNANMPFDQFTIEQLAGDLLPNATLSQRIATGFNRNHPVNTEAGEELDEYRSAYVIDRVHATTTTWLGLTVACAQCHDHKYDPISQREFYSFYGFFNSIKEKDNGFGRNPKPAIAAPGPDDAPRLRDLEQRIESLQQRLERDDPLADRDQVEWEQSTRKRLGDAIPWTTLKPTEFMARYGSRLTLQDDGSVRATGPVPARDTYELVYTPGKRRIEALRLEVLPDPSLPDGASGRADDGRFILTRLASRLTSVADSSDPPLISYAIAQADVNQERDKDEHYLTAIEPGSFAAAIALDDDKGPAHARRTFGGWSITGDARKQPREAILIPIEPLEANATSILRLTLEQHSSDKFKSLIGRFRVSCTEDPRVRKQLVPLAKSHWHSIGPFPATSADAAFEKAYGPESDLEEPSWKKKHEQPILPKPEPKHAAKDAAKAKGKDKHEVTDDKPTAKPAVPMANRKADVSQSVATAPEATAKRAAERKPPAAALAAEIRDEGKADDDDGEDEDQDDDDEPKKKPKPKRLTWNEQRTWQDGTKNSIAVEGPASAHYFSRKLHTEAPRTARIEFRGGNAAKVWLNGKLVGAFPPEPRPKTETDTEQAKQASPDKLRPTEANPDEAFLPEFLRRSRPSGKARDLHIGLRQGDNHLVVKLIGERAAAKSRRDSGDTMPAMAPPDMSPFKMSRNAPDGMLFSFEIEAEGDDVLDYETLLAVRARADEASPPLLTAVEADGNKRWIYTFTDDLDAADEPAKKKQLTPAERRAKVVRKWYRTRVDVTGRVLQAELRRLEREKEELEAKLPSALVMEELDTPRETHVFIRGDYRNKGERVDVGTPSVLPPMPPDLPKNRLGLAKWLVSGDHPLTARVTVNRAWQQFFGLGIVRTAEDFGIRGAEPSHAQLLDWLAAEFVASGWDRKKLHRLIVLSATYRQCSHADQAALERDPDNVLLARGPHQRLSAEMVRDQALAVSGLLKQKVGGESVKPFQPEGLWKATLGSRNWQMDEGDAVYRRGLYVYWKRGVPYPSFMAFDAAKRETCTVTRTRTTTPLQALVTLNDPVYVEAGRHLGARLMQEGGDDDQARITYGFRLVTSRRPELRELEILGALLADLRKHYEADEKAAKAALGKKKETTGADKTSVAKAAATPSAPPAKGPVRTGKPAAEPAEAAAWAQLGATLLNLEAAIRRG